MQLRFQNPIAVAGLVLGLATAAHARFEPPPPPKTYVYDGAGMLDSGSRSRIEDLLEAFNRERRIQFVVATFPSLEGDVLEEASLRVAERWKIGHRQVDSGLLLVVFKNDRALRFEVGYGLEGYLPDAVCDQIIRKVIVPRFREGDFSGGISAGVASATEVLVTGKADFGPEAPEAHTPPPELLVTVLQFLIFGLIIWRAIRVPRRGRYYGGGFGGGAFGGRGGGFGGGGFSGGGGGFGGGGASGRW